MIDIVLKGLIMLAYFGILSAVAIADWKTRKISNRYPVYIMLLGMAAVWIFPQHSPADRLMGAVIVSLPMLMLALWAKAFGGGDIKLMAASGWLLGWRAVLCAAVLGIAAAGVCCAWTLAKEKGTRKEQIALGPFLALGLGIAMLFGDEIWKWYIS